MPVLHNTGMKVKRFLRFVCFAASLPFASDGQDNRRGQADSFTLYQCVGYALEHQPSINQAQLNIAIARANNAINISSWLPQVNLSGNLVHYLQLPSSSTADSAGRQQVVRTGVYNTFLPGLTVSQAIFSPQLLYAAKSAHLYTRAAEQAKDSTRINIITGVSKAFYSLLLTLAQVDVLKEDTARLGRNVMDTYHQFVGGIVDETDYDEAVISLNNSKAQLRQQMENISPGYAVLKQLMGYPPEKQFNVVVDTVTMLQEIGFDTTQPLKYENRIEYQELQTAMQLQHNLTSYYRSAFLPSLSAFYNNYWQFTNNTATQLFNAAYPYSYVGLSVSLPVFTGFSRLENVRKARLQQESIDWVQVSLRSQIYTEYTSAMANYKSAFYNWVLLKENVTRARSAYRIVSLQYKEGIVAYLNMIVAESNLVSAEIGEINALFQLLSSKIDLERAMGTTRY